MRALSFLFSPPAFFPPLSLSPYLLFLRSQAEFNSLAQDKRKKIITRSFFPAFSKNLRPSFVPLRRPSFFSPFALPPSLFTEFHRILKDASPSPSLIVHWNELGLFQDLFGCHRRIIFFLSFRKTRGRLFIEAEYTYVSQHDEHRCYVLNLNGRRISENLSI